MNVFLRVNQNSFSLREYIITMETIIDITQSMTLLKLVGLGLVGGVCVLVFVLGGTKGGGIPHLFVFSFLKTWYPVQGPTNLYDQSQNPLAGECFWKRGDENIHEYCFLRIIEREDLKIL